MDIKAQEYISKLHLNRHPEGGYFNEIYRSAEYYEAGYLPGRYNKNRAFATSIYFLLEGNQVSNLHSLKSDEIWHFYDGSAILIYMLEEQGKLTVKKLGKDLGSGELFQVTIPKGCWFGAELQDKKSFGLIGCTVSPGFDFEDFELGERNFLLNLFPDYSEIIKKLTKFTP